MSGKKVKNLRRQSNFFYFLWGDIKRFARPLGITLKPYLKELRKEIWKEKRFLKKVARELQGAIYQFMMVSLLTTVMVIFSSTVIQADVYQKLFGLLGGELLGVFLFLWIAKKMMRKIFLPFDAFFSSLYGVKILTQLGTPLPYLWKETGLQQQKFIFREYYERVCYLLEKKHLEGGDIQEEIQEVIDDIWPLKEEKMQDFQKMMGGLRLFVLTLFFVVPYMSYLYVFFSGLWNDLS